MPPLQPCIHNLAIARQPTPIHRSVWLFDCGPRLGPHILVLPLKFGVLLAQPGRERAIDVSQIELVPAAIQHGLGEAGARLDIGGLDFSRGFRLADQRSGKRSGEMNSLGHEKLTQQPGLPFSQPR